MCHVFTKEGWNPETTKVSRDNQGEYWRGSTVKEWLDPTLRLNNSDGIGLRHNTQTKVGLLFSMKNNLSLFIQETLINHVFVQTTELDIHRNTHSLYTSKGSQSKEGSQVKTRPQTKMKSYESTWALSVPVESPNPKVWYTAQTHCLCLWGTEGDDGDAQRLEMSKCNDRKKKIYASSTEDPQVDIFRLVSCQGQPA